MSQTFLVMPSCPHCTTTKPLGARTLQPTSLGFKRALWFALIVNAAMFCVEIGYSFQAQSMALLADSADFLADALNYAASLLVLGMSVRVRARLALVKGFLMAALGIAVLIGAAYSFWQGSTPDASTVGWIALLALMANISAGAVLYRFKGSDSNALSVWLCTRNDAIGNLAVLASAFLVAYFDSALPDLLVASLLALLALSSARRVIKLALHELKESPSLLV